MGWEWDGHGLPACCCFVVVTTITIDSVASQAVTNAVEIVILAVAG